MNGWGCFCSFNINSLITETIFTSVTVGIGVHEHLLNGTETVLFQSKNMENIDSNYSDMNF